MAFPVGWNRRCGLTTVHSQINADMTAFPIVLDHFCLPNEMLTLGGGNAAQSDGGDIRFSSDLAGANQLPCEIVTFTQDATPANAVVEIWVAVDVLTASDVTFYVWYNAGGGQTQPAANASFGSQSVWDSNYKGVWHWKDGTTLSVGDSTGINTSTNHSATAGAGAVDGAMVSVSNAGYVDAGSNFPTGTTPAVTMECWIRYDSAQFQIIGSSFDAGVGGFIAFINSSGSTSNDIAIQWTGAGGNQSVTSVTNVTSIGSQWHITVTIASGGTCHVYLNGGEVSYLSNSPSAGLDAPTIHWNWGKFSSFGLDGRLDECRISNSVRSSAWHIASWYNQFAPSAFISAGTPGSPSTLTPITESVSDTIVITDSAVTNWPGIARAAADSLAISDSPRLGFGDLIVDLVSFSDSIATSGTGLTTPIGILITDNFIFLTDSGVANYGVSAAFGQRGNIDYDQIRRAARMGGGSKFHTFTGSFTPGHTVVFDADGNLIDAGH